MHANIIGHMYTENVESVKLETATANRDGLVSSARITSCSAFRDLIKRLSLSNNLVSNYVCQEVARGFRNNHILRWQCTKRLSENGLRSPTSIYLKHVLVMYLMMRGNALVSHSDADLYDFDCKKSARNVLGLTLTRSIDRCIGALNALVST